MNEIHKKIMQSGINVSLGGRKIRIKHTFGISPRQFDLTRRILKAREKIDSLPKDRSILVYADDPHIHYLFQLTKLAEKNVVGFIDEAANKSIYNPFGGFRAYPVYSLEEPEWRQAEYILIAVPDMALGKRLVDQGYSGHVEYLYDAEDTIAFFYVQEKMPVCQPDAQLNAFAQSTLVRACSLPDTQWFDMIRGIDKINRILEECGEGRIVVYGAGPHTNFLFEFTDIKYKNVIAMADRSVRTFCGIAVREVTAESFEDADLIVISSFWYQGEIENYLISIGLQDKIVTLYDMSDKAPFYELLNNYAPDMPEKFRSSKNMLTTTDLYASVEWSAGSLSANSEYLVTYNLLNNKNIDYGILHNKDEKEIIAEKDYSESNRQVAIVLQGPIVYDDDFTFRSLCYYSILFPEAKIILSTWEGEKENPEFERFYTLPIEIVLSLPPQEKGVLNVNYQVKSTYAGILRAKELGMEYVLKTRTDFRLYADDCLSYLCTLTKMFPAKGTSHKRITILQPFLDVAYYIPDYILFGDTDDMLNFWDASILYPNHTDGINPEMLMFTRYIKSINSYVEDPTEHLKDYMDMLCREFIIVDPATFKYYWKKYSYESSALYQEGRNRLTAADWFHRQFILREE